MKASGEPIESASVPTVEPSEDEGYTFRWDDGAVSITLNRIADGRSDTSAEITVSTTLPPAAGVLEWGRINLSAMTTRSSLAKALTDRMPAFDWQGALLQAAHTAVTRRRQGDPSVDLWPVPRRENRWLLWPYVEYGGPTVLYAKGDSCKSVLALAMAISVASGHSLLGKPVGPPVPVLYLDWETDAETHAERLRALCNANLFGCDPPQVRYRRMHTALADAAPDIRREVQARKMGMAVVDSVSYAVGAGIDINEQATASQFYIAAGILKIPVLAVSHIRKGRFESDDDSTPFGSVYWINGARVVWQLDTVKEEASHVALIRFIQRKANNTMRWHQHGYHLTFQPIGEDNDELAGIKLSRLDLATVPQFAGKLTWRNRIAAALGKGAMTRDDLAEVLEIDPQDKDEIKNLRVNVSREKRANRIIEFPDGRLGLRAKPVS